MADTHHDDLWRKNIPADYDGRQDGDWDAEIDTKVVYQSAVAIVVAVVVAFVFCWYLLAGFAVFVDEPVLSPLAEAQVRHLPATPALQSSPTNELDGMREDMAAQTGGYGWADPLADRVHIPVTKAMDLILAGHVKVVADKPAAAIAIAAPAPVPAAPAPAPAAAADHGAGH